MKFGSSFSPFVIFSLVLFLIIGSVQPSSAAAPLADQRVPSVVASSPVVINEFVFNHAGMDSDEMIELFGAPNSDLRSLALLVLDGDAVESGVIDAAISVGGTDVDGYWLAELATDTIEDGSLTLLLVDGFSGLVGDDLDTNNDGTLDFLSWTAILDSIAVSDGEAGDFFYATVVLEPGFDDVETTPGGASRIPNGIDTENVLDWMRNDFDLAGVDGYSGSAAPGEALNTPGRVNLPVVMINEFVLDHVGVDTYEFIEVFAQANKNYAGLTVLEIEGDGSSAGVIDEVLHLGVTNAAGYWSSGFLNNKLENGTLTLFLVQGFSGAYGNDLDLNNDGVLDVTPWVGLLDSLAVTDGTPGDLVYSPVLFAPGFAGVAEGVGGASRYPDGMDTNQLSDWLRNDFDLAGIPGFPGTPVYGDALNTPGAENQKYLPPDDLSINKTGPSTVKPGETFVYTIHLQNTSTAAASQVVLTDTLAAPLTYISDDSGAPLANPEAGVYVWSLGDLPGLSSTLIHLTVALDENVITPDLLNTAQVGSEMPTDDPLNNQSEWQTRIAYPLAIHDIQGAAHLSPYNGYLTTGVAGIVTAKSSSSFYMQTPDTQVDANEDTSQGILVFSGGAPNVDVGDLLSVTATVDEFYPGGISSGNLSTTELILPRIVVISSNHLLPSVTKIGSAGRMPPVEIIDNDSSGEVNLSLFDPAQDGIDFYESLEGMWVGVDEALVVGPTNRLGEIAVVPDAGVWANQKSVRGSLVVRQDDFNPERILIDDALVAAEPLLDVGAQFINPIHGVLDYSSGNYKLYNTSPLPATTGVLAKETTTLVRQDDQITVATLNAADLDANQSDGDDDSARLGLLAIQVVTNLDAPDILVLQGIQDNNGLINDGVVSADLTYTALINAITDAGGPAYAFADIAPVNNADGGETGGNIRVGFLYRIDRGLAFVSRPGGDALTGTAPALGTSGLEISYSPGRIDPTHTAFVNSRKPLVGEFTFDGKSLFVIGSHLNSKAGDSSLFGRFQPPLLLSDTQRAQQAQVIHDFVDSMLALDANAWIIVAGELNDHPFSAALQTLSGSVLSNLLDALPIAEGYTQNLDGNAQAFHHILVSDKLASGASLDIVHLNSEYDHIEQTAGHDPVLARFTLSQVEAIVYTNFLPLLLK